MYKNDNIKIDTENIEAYLERCRQSNKVFHLQEIYKNLLQDHIFLIAGLRFF